MDTTYDILENLKEMFGDQTSAARRALRRSTSKMEEGTQVRTHVLKMMSYSVEMVLNTLPPVFDTAETIIKQGAAPVVLNIERASSSVQKKGKKKKNVKPNNNGAANGVNGVVKKPKGKCFHCKQPGHWKLQCPTWLAKKKQGTSPFHLLVVETCLAVLTTHQWCVDSGATNHVCNSLQGFQETRQLSKGEVNIFLGDGTEVAVLAVGNIALNFKNNRTLILKNVLYVPSIRRNLISVSSLSKNGYSVCFNEFYDDSVVIKFREQMICSGSLIDGLYILKVTPELQLTNSEVNNFDIVAPLKNRISLLVKDGPLSSLQVEALPAANDVLELIHFDLCGPMSVQARGGFEYFVTFTDDYSRYGYIYLLRRKSECFEKFKAFKAETEKRHGKYIKTLRFDRGGEYISREFINFLSEQGITSQLSAPGMPQQNGVAERRNRTLMEMTYILNLVPSKSIPKTPTVDGCKPDLKHVRMWVVRHMNEGGLFYSPKDKKIIVSTNAHYLEEDYIRNHIPKSQLALNELRGDTIPARIFPSEHEPEPFMVSDILLPQRSGRNVSGPEFETSDISLPIGDEENVEAPVHVPFEEHIDEACCEGYTRKEGIDYEETFPYFDYEIWQMDVKTTFLNGSLDECIYMKQPEGFITNGQEHLLCKLNRSIYGLKQASRSWNTCFDQTIKTFGFDQCHDESCVYKKWNGKKVVFLVLYVDDILLIGNCIGMLTSVKDWLSQRFDMKDLGEAAHILGIKLMRNRKKRMIGLSQALYIDTILNRFNMQGSKKGFLPFRHGIVLSKDHLMYAMLCTRPDICFFVGMVSDFESNRERTLDCVKHIIKYLKELEIVYFQSDQDSRKSTSGNVFVLGGGTISWRSIKQTCVADSTMEAEYVAASEAAKEAVWLRNFLLDLGVVPSVQSPITLYCDNSGAVANSKEPRSHKRAKHIERKYHLIRDIVQRGDVVVMKIASENNLADPFTKSLSSTTFERHVEGMG
ncbi:hypothetical protein AAG906_014654 [Vitis piasezkii]